MIIPKKSNSMSNLTKLEIVLLLKAEEKKWEEALDLGDLVPMDHKRYLKGHLDGVRAAIDIVLGIDSSKFDIE